MQATSHSLCVTFMISIAACQTNVIIGDSTIDSESCTAAAESARRCIEDKNAIERCATEVAAVEAECTGDYEGLAFSSGNPGDIVASLAASAELCFNQATDPTTGCFACDSERCARVVDGCENQVKCLQNVYNLLALGGLYKELEVAALHLLNFLACGQGGVTQPEMVVPEAALRADGFLEGLKDQFTEGLSGQRAVLEAASGGQVTFDDFTTVVHAYDNNLYFGLGSFTAMGKNISGTVDRDADGNLLVTVDLDYEFRDRYDWHPELAVDLPPGGEDGGWSMFSDSWPALLVAAGVGCEFDISGGFHDSFTISLDGVDPDPPVDPDLPPVDDGVCAHSPCKEGDALPSACSEHVTALCEVDEYCCSTFWDDTCISELPEYGIASCS